jgi:hypothetical protein
MIHAPFKPKAAVSKAGVLEQRQVIRVIQKLQFLNNNHYYPLNPFEKLPCALD